MDNYKININTGFIPSRTSGMPKRFIKRILPHHDKIREHKHVRLFGTLLHDPNLWHLNRRSVSGALSVGLFTAFIPVPFQMVIAAGISIIVRVNLPISAALVWVTNPLTMPPLFYFAYKIGAWLLNEPPRHFHFELSIAWLQSSMTGIWQPFLLGCLVCGLTSAVLGNVILRLFWRWRVIRNWEQRTMSRRTKVVGK